MDRGLPGLPIVLAISASIGVIVAALVAVVIALVPDDVAADPGPKPTVTEYVPKPGPTVTQRVPVPGPTVTVTAKPRQSQAAARSRSLGSSDEAFLRCVVKRESGGDPRAQNPSSSASGLFQFIDSTWRAYAKESGIGDQYARAKHAPAATQWALARWVVENKGRYPWKPTVPGTGC
jgi:Transglycosylase-like domain